MPVFDFGYSLGEPRGNITHLRLRLLERHAGLQECDGVNSRMAVAVLRSAQRILMAPKRTEHGKLAPGGMEMAAGQHTHDGINLAIERESFFRLNSDLWQIFATRKNR